MSYPQSTPIVEHADPFGPSAAIPRRYVYSDNDSDNVESYGRRDTYASDSSNNGLNDTERYYDHNGTYDPYAQQDTDSDVDVYGRGYAPSAESLGQSRMGPSESSATAYVEYAAASGVRDQYPAWTTERQIPLSKEEIEDIFLDLAQKFGFQRDSMRNMFDFLMQLLDSRASRMSPNQALLTLHADYIGGEHANYRKWYFAAQLDLDDAVGHVQNPGLQRLRSTRRNAFRNTNEKSLQTAYGTLAPSDEQHESVRFVPECLCFIFKCADDYYRSPECQSRVDPVPEGLYLRAVIKPLYRFIRDQGYEVVDGRFVRKERDHVDIIGYDDVNQLFWYPEGIARITLSDKTRLIDLPPSHRYMKFDRIDWDRAFFKTYYEKRSFGHLLVNFNRIWVIHISLYWYYTAYNSPKVYQISKADNTVVNSPALMWSVTALGGACGHAHHDCCYSRGILVYPRYLE
ncbi:1,3-beta-glucan synthase subunit FKS1, domain-1-domain-containing protein [Chiua virens]|nr:1,3-beta-glucan synthase subunit FKS1, domain-1-domain-containing protein [Chiua virens]